MPHTIAHDLPPLINLICFITFFTKWRQPPAVSLGGVTLLVSSAMATVNVTAVTAIAPPAPVIAQASARLTLKLGSTGRSVQELQGLLTLLGYYDGAIDGAYQTSTETAVKAFQQDAGLTGDGIVGPATWEKLLPSPSTDLTPPAVSPPERADNLAASAPVDRSQTTESVSLPTLKTGMRGPAVTQVQRTLQGLGFYEGPLDGIFGPGTETAVMNFQQSVGLVADGIVGPVTWRSLLR